MLHGPDARGGYYAEGRVIKPLVDGAASLVIRSDGTPTVAKWGRDATLGPDTASVRQNLSLIVDDGAPVAGLGVTGVEAGVAEVFSIRP